MLRNQGCDQLADLYDAAGDQLVQQLTVTILGGIKHGDRGLTDNLRLGSTPTGEGQLRRSPQRRGERGPQLGAGRPWNRGRYEGTKLAMRSTLSTSMAK